MNTSTSAPALPTVLHDWHVRAGANMQEFGGYEMPVSYDSILSEHLATRARAGLFDVSHMGRFRIRGAQAMPFLRRALTNDPARLPSQGGAQYTLLADAAGRALDDAFLYRLDAEDFLLVVNAANRSADWAWLGELARGFERVDLSDQSEELAMVALQGPVAERLLQAALSRYGSGALPVSGRNTLSRIHLDGASVVVARTGYTGEPLSFELFPPAATAVRLWELLLGGDVGAAAVPVGLGARDTLRLEAGLPLYGHELGRDLDGESIPIMALRGIAARGVDLSDPQRDFVGREALQRQQDELTARHSGSRRRAPAAGPSLVPRFIRRLAVLNTSGDGPGTNPVRRGHAVRREGVPVGWVTSGTVVPFWRTPAVTAETGASGRRAIALAYIDAEVSVARTGTQVEVDKGRGRPVSALLVRANLRVEAGWARPVLHPLGS